jgi:deoxyribodipyrimidine photolyase-related protein
MKPVILTFPNQLFASHLALRLEAPVYLIEHPRFFSDFAFHKQKLVLHRASLKAYQDVLAQKGVAVNYLEHGQVAGPKSLFDLIRKEGFKEIVTFDPVDEVLEEHLKKSAAQADLKLTMLKNPGFLCTKTEIKDFFQDAEKFHQTQFYRHQRRRLDILMEDGKPAGGRWTYDTANRRKLPKDVQVPPLPKLMENSYVTEAKRYVAANFPDYPGSLETWIYPTTHDEAQGWLADFLKHRLAWFGDYEDAISASEPYIFHSVLSPVINIGLLTPQEVLEAALAHAHQHSVPINSLEGFVRQIIGWREYVRAVYVLAGKQQRAANFWGHTQEMPQPLYTGETGIDPVDTVIKRLLQTGYAHHIERLMVLGNFMLLCEIDPDEVYRWFMELFIDSYDWVMVPNVYGMSQFADGGLIMTKPYVSGSNYMRKMSDFPAGPWCDVWDGLYWRFIEKRRNYFAKNPRLAPMVKNLDRMKADRLKRIFGAAEAFLAKLYD